MEKLKVSHEISQQLKLNPSVSLGLEILQLSILDLEDFIIGEIESNPFIEVEDDTAFIFENSKTYYSEIEFDSEFKKNQTTLENLIEQINLNFDGIEKEIAVFIVNNLSKRGLLLITVEEISDKFGVDTETVNSVRKNVKHLNPVGCGSYSIEELLQTQFEEMEAPHKLVKALSYLKLLTSPETFRLKAGLTEQEYKDFVSYLRRCDLMPFDSGNLNLPVKPEAKVELEEDKVRVEVINFRNFNFRINEFYLKYAENKELKKFILEKYYRALSLKKALDQRKETLKKVVKAVFERQKEFLHDGKTLVPLTLSEIAAEVSLHESTVSRTVNGKFVKTPFGVFSLKHFFPRGRESSTVEQIKDLIKELIENEDKKKPLSDERISQILQERGFKIARRTVAKYRENLGIPGVFKRKVKQEKANETRNSR